MLQYRRMEEREAERIAEIDATHYIENVWRRNGEGVLTLQRIDWTDRELPNGFGWHLNRFREALMTGGTAFGCLEADTLVGYAVLRGQVFGRQNYVLLDQLFVSVDRRGQGIGRTLFMLCADRARKIGAKKLYLCAGSAERTVAFYQRLGCVPAMEPDPVLQAEDPNDIQLEYVL